MKLSVVIVSYNVCHFVEQCLDSVQKATEGLDVEVFVVDNDSADDTVETIGRRYPWVHLIANDENYGFARANNIAIRQAKGEYLNFMNGGDCYHSEDVLEKIFALKTDADIITGTHSENGLRNVGKGGVTMLDLYKWAIDHQASFIRREVALRHPYDEKYRIVSDWKFFIEALILDNCSFYYTDTIVVDVDMEGISNTNFELD